MSLSTWGKRCQGQMCRCFKMGWSRRLSSHKALCQSSSWDSAKTSLTVLLINCQMLWVLISLVYPKIILRIKWACQYEWLQNYKGERRSECESLSRVRLYVTPWCSPPGSSVHGISQARILEWVAIPFSRGSSQPRTWTWVSYTAGRFFTFWATREARVLM